MWPKPPSRRSICQVRGCVRSSASKTSAVRSSATSNCLIWLLSSPLSSASTFAPTDSCLRWCVGRSSREPEWYMWPLQRRRGSAAYQVPGRQRGHDEQDPKHDHGRHLAALEVVACAVDDRIERHAEAEQEDRPPFDDARQRCHASAKHGHGHDPFGGYMRSNLPRLRRQLRHLVSCQRDGPHGEDEKPDNDGVAGDYRLHACSYPSQDWSVPRNGLCRRDDDTN